MSEDIKTIQELLRTLRKFGEDPAIISFGKEEVETRTYRDLFEEVAGLSAGLAKSINKDQETVAICAGNSPQWVAAALAVIYSGNILLPIDQQSDGGTLEHIFRDSGAGFVFADGDTAEKIAALELAEMPRIFRLDVAEGDERRLAATEPVSGNFFRRAAPDDTAVLFYTSGTTGAPKGVPLSHANLVGQPEAIGETELIIPSDRVLLPLPMHHVYPFVLGMLTPLATGLPIVFPDSLTGRAIVRAVAEGGATIIIGVPRLYRTLYDGIHSRIAERGRIAALTFDAILGASGFLRRRFGILAGRRLFPFIHRQFGSSLRVLASGGSALDRRLAHNLEGLGWQVAVGYGLTETSPMLTINLPGSGRLRSVGKAIKGVDISISNADPPDSSLSADSDNSPEKTGEVLVRGPNVFKGYLHLPDQTREAFTEEGWFRTGDLGRLDGEGFLYLHGRVKTLMVTESGENLQPDEIEEIYEGHPAIREIGVFLNQGRLTGVIVPELKQTGGDGGDLEKVIRKAVAEKSAKLPSFKVLDQYVITRQSLARTRLGKIRRHLLEERYRQAKKGEEAGGGRGAIPLAEMSDRDQALLEDKNAGEIWSWLGRKYPDRRLTPDSSPRFDLGIDSLEWLDVSLEVQQRTGIELSEETIGRIETVRDLLEEVSRQAESKGAADPERPLREPESVLSDDQKRWLRPQGTVMSLLRFILYRFNRLLMKLLFRLEVIGGENLSVGDQYLITPNHASFLDPLAIAAAIPYDVLVHTHFAGWTGIAFRNAFFRFFSRLAQAVPIDDRHAVSSSLAFGSAVLGRGKSLIWFPEGGRSPDGTLREFKPGVSLLLEHHDVAVVPVYIDGAYEALPRGARLPRFRKITVIFGQAVSRDGFGKGEDRDSARDAIRKGLRREVARLGEEMAKKS